MKRKIPSGITSEVKKAKKEVWRLRFKGIRIFSEPMFKHAHERQFLQAQMNLQNALMKKHTSLGNEKAAKKAEEKFNKYSKLLGDRQVYR